MDGLLELDGLTRRYGPDTALDNLSFSVPAGQVMGFLGPNGAGKTTTTVLDARRFSAASRPSRPGSVPAARPVRSCKPKRPDLVAAGPDPAASGPAPSTDPGQVTLTG